MAWNDNTNAILAMDNFYGPNPYSNFSGQPLPWPSSYAGTPTDARGNPIQPPPGLTLNQAPAAAPQAAPAAAQPALAAANNMSQLGGTLAQRQAYNSVRGLGGQAALGGATQVGYDQSGKQLPYPVANPAYTAAMMGQGQQAAPAQHAPPQQAPGTTDLNSALSMLANPGHVTTPGAQPAAAPQGPSVLQSFLANNQGGTAGNYSNKGFFNTLNALKGATQPGGAT
jgi:hypothetical protein